MGAKVTVDFVANEADLIAAAKNAQKEMDAFSAKLKAAGVSGSAFNKAMSDAKRNHDAATNAAKKQGFSLTELNSAVSLLQTGLQYLSKAYDQTVVASMKYASQVRDLAAISGTGAEESSRLLQVLDDFEVSAEDVTTAVRKMTSQGLVPTVDTLAELSDQYLAINDPMKRNQFILDNLGKSGLQWTNVLKQGSTELRKLSGEVNKNLVLTEAQVKKAEEYRLAMDNLNDQILGLKIALGNNAIPALLHFTETMNGAISVTDKFPKLLQGLSEEIENVNSAADAGAIAFDLWRGVQQGMLAGTYGHLIAGNRELEDTTNNATISFREMITESGTMGGRFVETAASIENAKEKLQAMSESNELFLGVLGQVVTAQEAYRGGLAAANAELAAGTITVDEHKAKVGELSAEYEAAKNQIVLSIVEMKLATDGWTDAELSAYLSVGQKLGVFTTDQKKAAEGAILMAERMIDAVDPINHVGERAEDAALKFGDMADSSEELGEKINSSALPAVAGLKTAINGLQDKTVYIDVVIRQHGGSGSGIFNDGFLEDSGGPLCFAAGTPVTLSDGRTKPIEKIQVGDAVRSYSLARREFVTGKVTQNFQRSQPAYLNIDGIKVTVEHPFWLVNRSEWVKASEIKRNDILMRDNGSWQTVRNITFIVGEIEVYNMEVEGEHNYFAGGVLVHNKTQQGGEVFAGQPTLVGEAGPEPFVPSQNGRILGHAESLHAMTLGGGGAGGMGGGITMYNYGHVTVSGDSETGKDFMEIR
jgi:hypothetical protein